MKSFFFSKIGLVIMSTLLPLILGAAGYEIYRQIEHAQWSKEFSKQGWFKKMTIPSPNETLIWEYRPYGTALGGFALNRYGFRDRDYETPKKPDDVYRIAFVGDSVTLGMLIGKVENVFVSKFEKLVNERREHRRVQALNFAVDGYNTLQITEMIRKKVLPFEPDKIVYVMCLNDFDFETSSGFKMLLLRPPKSFLWQKLRILWRNFRKIEFHRYCYNLNEDEVYENIAQTNKDLKKKGYELEAAILPVFPVPPFFAGGFDHYQFHDIHEDLHRFFKSQQIPYVDLLPDFVRYKDRPIFELAFDTWHPTVFGHQVIAEALARKLKLN